MRKKIMNNMFTTGKKVTVCLYTSKCMDEINLMMPQFLDILHRAPVLTNRPGVDFEVRLTDVYLREEDEYYKIIGEGVII